MAVTNSDSGTRIDEIAAGIYRISTPVPPSDFPGGFTFNQFLIDDDAPLLFHTGLRQLFPLVREGDHQRPRPASPALPGVLTRRGGRVRRAQSVSVHRTRGRGALRRGRSGRLRAGPRRSPTPSTDRRGRGLSRPAHRALALHASPAPCMGVWLPVREHDTHVGFGERGVSMSRLGEEISAEERPTTLACMHGSAWRGDGGSLLRELAGRLATAAGLADGA